MGRYSIKELEKLSGIKAHTLRIWEKRYDIITPERTSGNIRYYSDEQLKKLLNVSILNHAGVKISKIVKYTKSEIDEKVSQLNANQANSSDLSICIDKLCLAMVGMDESDFEKTISNCILRIGFDRTILEVLYPFLEKIGILWLTDNITPVQEHFVSNLIRQKIIVAIDGISKSPKQNSLSFVLFLPEHELHEIGLLFYHYIIKSHGFKSYYLGQCVPLDNLVNVVNDIEPDYIITTISHESASNPIEEFIPQLALNFPDSQLLTSGQPLFNFKGELPRNMRIAKSAIHMNEIISSL